MSSGHTEHLALHNRWAKGQIEHVALNNRRGNIASQLPQRPPPTRVSICGDAVRAHHYRVNLALRHQSCGR